jgi:hypothetical protein
MLDLLVGVLLAIAGLFLDMFLELIAGAIVDVLSRLPFRR